VLKDSSSSQALSEIELQLIQQAFREANGSQTQAAKLLCVSQQTVSNKLKAAMFPGRGGCSDRIGQGGGTSVTISDTMYSSWCPKAPKTQNWLRLQEALGGQFAQAEANRLVVRFPSPAPNSTEHLPATDQPGQLRARGRLTKATSSRRTFPSRRSASSAGLCTSWTRCRRSWTR
jgi:hypothetical protein